MTTEDNLRGRLQDLEEKITVLERDVTRWVARATELERRLEIIRKAAR